MIDFERAAGLREVAVHLDVAIEDTREAICVVSRSEDSYSRIAEGVAVKRGVIGSVRIGFHGIGVGTGGVQETGGAQSGERAGVRRDLPAVGQAEIALQVDGKSQVR